MSIEQHIESHLGCKVSDKKIISTGETSTLKILTSTGLSIFAKYQDIENNNLIISKIFWFFSAFIFFLAYISNSEKNKKLNEETAKKRIKIGLILNEFGEQNSLKVNEEEIRNEIQKQIQMMPNQAKQITE